MLDLAIKAVYTTNVSFGKGNNWIYGAETSLGTAGVKLKPDPSDSSKYNFYTKIDNQNVDSGNLKWSKSLISFEVSEVEKFGKFTDKEGNEKYFLYPASTFKLYFPIILGEYVSKGDESDEQIIQKLLTDNQIIDLLKKVNVKEIIKLLTPENLIDQTDDLYKQIFGEATSSEDQMLNNMLLKLINFDEET